jgi:hypothetical protein
MAKDNKGRIDFNKVGQAYEKMRQQLIQDPSLAKATLRASAKLLENLKMEGRIGGFKFECDEPPVRGGDDTAPSPLHFFLIGAAF